MPHPTKLTLDRSKTDPCNFIYLLKETVFSASCVMKKGTKVMLCGTSWAGGFGSGRYGGLHTDQNIVLADVIFFKERITNLNTISGVSMEKLEWVGAHE